MQSWIICHGDARHLPLRDEVVQMVVTSPPYWGLRDYGLSPLVWGGREDCVHEWLGRRWYTEQSAAKSGSAEAFSEPGEANAQRLKEARWWQDSTCVRCDAWKGSLGLESTPDLYVQHLVEIFREVRRVLRRDGVLWLNLGDSYASAWPAPNTRRNIIGNPMTGGKRGPLRQSKLGSWGLKEKDLIGMPWRVAFALQADGWWLRSDIIWAKPNPMPESVTDRPTKAHEYIFLLSKAATYFYDAEAIKEPSEMREDVRWRIKYGGYPAKTKSKVHSKSDGDGKPDFITAGKRYWPATRNRRSVWTIATEPFPDAHFATFPTKLVEPCIKAGTSEKGCCPQCGMAWARVLERQTMIIDRSRNHPPELRTRTSGTMVKPPQTETLGWRPTCSCPQADPIPQVVLDPFAGSGTTGLVALRLGQRFVGVDLSAEYCRMAVQRIEKDMPLFNVIR